MSNTHEGKVLKGQQYKSVDDLVVPYTEQIQNYDGDAVEQLGAERTEITPVDAHASQVRVWEIPTEAIETIHKSYTGTTDLDLPNVLTGIVVTYNTAEGIGNHNEDAAGVSAGFNASLTLNLNSKAQASASIVPDIQPTIKQKWARNVPCTFHLFYMASGYTQAQLLTKLATLANVAEVLPWPKFEPVSHTFTLKGASATASADADVQQHVSISDSNTTYTWGEGEGESWELSTTTKTIVIPPTIHGVITLTDTSASADLEAHASASWEAATNWPARSAAKDTTGFINASVSPVSLSATSPSAIPTSGTYLHRVFAEPYDWGYIRVRAELINFADV